MQLMSIDPELAIRSANVAPFMPYVAISGSDIKMDRASAATLPSVMTLSDLTATSRLHKKPDTPSITELRTRRPSRLEYSATFAPYSKLRIGFPRIRAPR